MVPGLRGMLTTTTILIAMVMLASPAHAQLQCVLQNGSCVIDTNGINGTDGPDGTDSAKNGSWGTEGSAGGVNTSNFDNQTGLVSSGAATSPVNITAFGGNGGNGGNAYPSSIDNNYGGKGIDGMDGGAINATIGPNTGGLATIGSTGLNISGVTILSLGGTAGGGGVSSYHLGSFFNGTSGTGGNGLSVLATVGGEWQSSTGDGIYIGSLGGAGGTGRSGGGGLADGANGGQGGDSSSVTATITGQVYGATTGVHVVTAGGNGGNGGNGGSLDGDGAGNGGTGGQAGNVTATLAAGAKITMGAFTGQGFVVGSYGGAGGAGGNASAAGVAGAGGNAGNAAAIVNGTITSYDKNDSYGVLVQSIGGVGGDGGRSAAWFNPQGGNGNLGGTAGTATITGTGANIQTGVESDFGDENPQNETAVLAQSIGGGGGIGGSAKDGWVAVGGAGGDGSPGNAASATLTDSVVITNTFLSSGIVAQSIGGGGGKGGDATRSDGAIVNMVVGGTGGAGGGAGDAFAGNLGNGTVTTRGDHSPGVVMHSIGGGGGSGGAGYGMSASYIFGAAVSVGGTGSTGGDAGTANAAKANNNSGAIVTSGAESFGILAQSIGGGGGSGGASTAKSIVFASDDFPAFSLALATGGSGAMGGSAEAAYLQNTAFIATTGNGAAGMVGQAIGGGGGTGGDADGSSNASEGGFNFAATVTHGGTGGGGGDGDDATGVNGGLIITRGESADGMLIQSIGGGGGAGGAGDALGATEEQISLSTTISLGGSGGGGGEGYDVSATNTGAILTLGDGSHGILAQTIGGGGGRGGGAAASASGLVGMEVAVGGSGGDGGDTYYNGSGSQVTNTGTILTLGADAGGILAQSVGGGGGTGGKAGTTLGSSTSNNDGSNGADTSVSGTITNFINNADNDYENAVAEYDNMGTLVSTAASMLGLELSDGDIVEKLDQTSSFVGSLDFSNVSSNNSFIVSVGGRGGAGGAGGEITVTNNGGVATMGNLSDAIVAQSIGGGGGKGGATSTAASESWLVSPGVNSGVNIGGSAQGAGDPNATNGAGATVTNTGSVYTTGAIAAGIVAQSVGMGGGIGGTTTVINSDGDGGQELAFAVSVGGSSTLANGVSEIAKVTSSGAIQTLGHDSYGIIAQSVSGGGGIVKTLAANLDYASGSANTASSKDFSGDISLGSDHGVISGYSGAAWVQTMQGGTITTSGDNGIGILVQSVAGGGGLALGGKPNGTTALEFLGSGGKTGSVNPGDQPDMNTGVIVEVGDDITTSGNGGVGVFAQSVGGGGGISGDIGSSKSFGLMGSNHSSFVGNGGDVQVTVDAGATITTTGESSAGIIAQSVGGGGGWIGTQDGAYVGSAGGTGDGYPVFVTVNGSVDARGANSPGIFVQSTGGADNGGTGTGSEISVTVGSATNSAASVWGGNVGFDQAAAVYFANGGTVDFPNQLTNYGTIATHDTVDGTAIFGDGLYFAGTNYGQITGNIHLKAGDITNEGSGTIHTYSAVDLGGGTLDNKGIVSIGADRTLRLTTLSGDFVQHDGARLVIDVDHKNSAADHFGIDGDAEIAGEVFMRPVTLTPTELAISSLSGAIDASAASFVTGSPFFSYSSRIGDASDADSSLFAALAKPDAITPPFPTVLYVTPDASFPTDDPTLRRTGRAIAEHLQTIWDGDHPEYLADGFAKLAMSGDVETQALLSTLAGPSINAIGAARLTASSDFVAETEGCPALLEVSVLPAQTNCVWARALGGTARASDDAVSTGYSADSGTILFGGQVMIDPDLLFAGSLGYERLTIDGNDDGVSVDGNAVLGAIGLTYLSGPFLVSGTFDFGYGRYDSTRVIDLGQTIVAADASPKAGNVGLHARFAYETPMGEFSLRPQLDLAVNYIRTNGYSESGAGDLDLTVAATDKVVFSAAPSVELARRVTLKDGTRLRLFAGLGVDFLSDANWETEARFTAAPPSAGTFTSEIDNPDVIGRFRVGVDVLASSTMDIKLEYHAAFADGFVSHAGFFRLNYRY